MAIALPRGLGRLHLTPATAVAHMHSSRLQGGSRALPLRGKEGRAAPAHAGPVQAGPNSFSTALRCSKSEASLREIRV